MHRAGYETGGTWFLEHPVQLCANTGWQVYWLTAKNAVLRLPRSRLRLTSGISENNSPPTVAGAAMAKAPGGAPPIFPIIFTYPVTGYANTILARSRPAHNDSSSGARAIPTSP